MKTASLSGSLRENVGKKDATAMRKSGQVPGVLYGGSNQVHLTLNEIKLSKLVVNPDVFAFDLDIDGKVIKCILQDIQFHPVTDRIVHFDLLEVTPGKELRLNLPLRSEGKPIGVINGGQMETLFRRVPVMGLLENLPDALTADVSKLKIGDNLRVGDLNIDGIKVLLNETVLLFACRRTRLALSVESETEGEEGGADAGAEGEAAADSSSEG